jgi:zinc transporter, ZIP family
VTVDAGAAAAPRRVPTWLLVVVPLALLAVLLAIVVRTAPGAALQPADAPPIEQLIVERVTLDEQGIRLTVLNDGPDPVTIAQVIVDDAYWAFTAEGATTLGHLGRTTLHVPYPWVPGEAHAVRLLTASGATFDHEIPVAIATPSPGARSLGIFTLVGLYVGVIPVALGLLWYPLLARIGRTGVDALLALTVGLLAFLFVDAAHEGLETAGAMAASYQGTALFVACAVAAWLALESLGTWLKARRGREKDAGSPATVLALLVAIGIGLHNFGEGLAIGAAYALGEAALGTLLILGFTLHNTTEGLAIVAPLARERPSLGQLARLGAIGGLPTIAGAWAGGLVYSPVVAVACLGLGAGAIVQVVIQIARQVAGREPMVQRFAQPPLALGLLSGFAVMYVTGLLVG